MQYFDLQIVLRIVDADAIEGAAIFWPETLNGARKNRNIGRQGLAAAASEFDRA